MAVMSRKGLAALWRHFQGDEDRPRPSLAADKTLHALPNPWLERVAPDPSVNGWVTALGNSLALWLNTETPSRSVIFVVAPPYTGSDKVLTAWAEQRGWRVLPSPKADRILSGTVDDPVAWQAGATPWVLPRLERCYLRHVRGLGLVRRILAAVDAGMLGRGVIGCDSWAWAYLQHVWQGRSPVVMVPQALDRQRLTHYLVDLIDPGLRDGLDFKQSDNGAAIFGGSENEGGATSRFLDELLAHSRGLAGVAHAIWRIALRYVPDSTETMDVVESASSSRRTIWVAPWGQLELPTVPSGAGHEVAFVLHALLLHGGLTTDLLTELLPRVPHQVTAVLAMLDDRGLVRSEGDVWTISPLGYPAVREFLKNEEYLLDVF